jgi:dGTPase
MILAPYASIAEQTRGRRYAEPAAPTRSNFQRDRDRIVHSTAFRRLVYKTQVFLNHEGDLFRTRLTHSLEVAQLGRSIARSLRLDEDLVEAIALAHDLGHTPFGHAGQDALNECMQAHGGFEHNLQSLRVVDWLEERYPSFDGLNLCFETREGILKHCSQRNAQALEQQEPGGVGQRFLARTQPSLEAQLCNLADEIAYNAHDIDDGLRSGLITWEQMEEIPLFVRFKDLSAKASPGLVHPDNARRWAYDVIRRMLSALVYDVIETSSTALAHANLPDAEAARQTHVLIGFSDATHHDLAHLKKFLFQNLYRHNRVMQTTDHAKRIIADLFQVYMHQSTEMPFAFLGRLQNKSNLKDGQLARVVADYIAGMTDRFASKEHERLTGKQLLAAS